MKTMPLMNRPKQEHKSQRTQGQHHQLTIPVIKAPHLHQPMLTPSFVQQRHVPKITMNKLWI